MLRLIMAASACDSCRRLFLRGSLPDDKTSASAAPQCPICGGKLRETCDSCRGLPHRGADSSAAICPLCGSPLRDASPAELRAQVRQLKDESRKRRSA